MLVIENSVDIEPKTCCRGLGTFRESSVIKKTPKCQIQEVSKKLEWRFARLIDERRRCWYHKQKRRPSDRFSSLRMQSLVGRAILWRERSVDSAELSTVIRGDC